jgi:hypothetical protein
MLSNEGVSAAKIVGFFSTRYSTASFFKNQLCVRKSDLVQCFPHPVEKTIAVLSGIFSFSALMISSNEIIGLLPVLSNFSRSNFKT